MRRFGITAVAFAALALGLLLPMQASAEEKTSTSALVPVAGAAVGAIVFYYAFPNVPAAVIGALVGAELAHWWYRSGDGDFYERLPPQSQADEAGSPLLRPIAADGARHPAIRAELVSAAPR